MRVLLYVDRDGSNPVKKRLDELGRERPEEQKAILQKLRIIRDLTFEESVGAGHIKPVRGKIWSLKMRQHQARILGFREGDHFVAARLTIKKQDELDDRDISVAKSRREDWLERRGS